MSNTITNQDSTIDSRDVIERIEELEADYDYLQSRYQDCLEHVQTAEQTDGFMYDNKGNTLNELQSKMEEARKALTIWGNSEDYKELATLKALADQGESESSDWAYGEQLIRHDYFKQAMDEMVADCYTLPKDLPFWMSITYDYDALKQDYAEIDYDGVTYYIRSV